jgi:hypothetical protein
MRTLRLHSEGPDVVDWRAEMAAIGYVQTYSGSPEYREYFTTTDALLTRALQRDARITIDGVVGPQTRAAMSRMERRGACAPREGLLGHDATERAMDVRLSKLVALAAGGQCGYYSNTRKDGLPGVVVGRASEAQEAKAQKLGYTTTHGLTCGHLAALVATVAMGHPTSRLAATGMNLVNVWGYRSPIWYSLRPSSSCAVALLDGQAEIGVGTGSVLWTWRPFGYARCFDRVASLPTLEAVEAEGGGVVLLEYGSHMRAAICAGYNGAVYLTDPEYHHPARRGWYLLAADGTKATTGRPWTFRALDPASDLRGIRHIWRMFPGRYAYLGLLYLPDAYVELEE